MCEVTGDSIISRLSGIHKGLASFRPSIVIRAAFKCRHKLCTGRNILLSCNFVKYATKRDRHCSRKRRGGVDSSNQGHAGSDTQAIRFNRDAREVIPDMRLQTTS